MARFLVPLAVACVGVLVGTVLGARVLKKIPEATFKSLVSLLLIALGLWVLAGSVVALLEPPG